MTTLALPRFTINQQASAASQLGKPHHSDPKYAKCVGFDDDLVALEKFFTWKSDLDRAKTYTPFLNKYYEPSIYRAEDVSGEETLLKVKQTVHGFFPKGRFPFQISLHSQILRATLKQTLGDDYDRCVNRVCEEHGWDGPKRNLIAIASRRSGKTTATASMVASLLINVPSIEIVVYSVGLRSAQEFVRLVERYAQMHETGRDMIKNPGGSETLVLRGKNPGDNRRIRSFPSGGNAKNKMQQPEVQEQQPFQDVEMGEGGLDSGFQSMREAVQATVDETGEQHEVESTEEVIPILDKFDLGIRNVKLDKLEPYLLNFETELRELVNSLGPGRIPRGYVGRQVLVSVLGHVGRIVTDTLGEKHALDSRDGIDFAIELASILYPNTYGVPTYDVLFYDELLEPKSPTSTRGAVIIREEMATELQEKALRRIALMQQQVNALESPEAQAAEIQRLQPEFVHLTQIAAGFYPAPFNAEQQHRWLAMDVGVALDPDLDPKDSFTLSPENITYLGKIAHLALEDYKANPDEVSQNSKLRYHQQVLRDFLEYGRLREPWHVAPQRIK